MKLNSNLVKHIANSPKALLAFNLRMPIVERLHDLPGMLRAKQSYQDKLALLGSIKAEIAPKLKALRQAESALAGIGSKLRGKEFRGYEQEKTFVLPHNIGTIPGDLAEQNNPFSSALKSGLDNAQNENYSESNREYQKENNLIAA